MYLSYLWLVLKHKAFVAWAGLKLGLPLHRLLRHDLSKFSRAEFGPYARRFKGGNAGKLDHSHDPDEWQCAWLHHWHRNPHHWEHWLRIKGDSNVTPIQMPLTYVIEMVADWKGAGRAYTGSWDIDAWYEANKGRMILHPHTRAQVEDLLGIPRESLSSPT